MQAQDSPPFSLLELDIEDYLGESEVNSENASAQQIEAAPLADTLKNQLQSMLTHLEKDVVELVQDAEPILNIFRVIKSQLSPELLLAISPAAYIEGQESKVLVARQRLADRLAYQQLTEQKKSKKQEVIDLKQKIEDLKKTPAQIDEKINQLKIEEARLESLLVRVKNAIKVEEQKKKQVPDLIGKVTEDLKSGSAAPKLKQKQASSGHS